MHYSGQGKLDTTLQAAQAEARFTRGKRYRMSYFS